MATAEQLKEIRKKIKVRTGRPKGSQNVKTILKTEIEKELRDNFITKVSKHFDPIIKTLIKRARDMRHKDGTMTKADLKATIYTINQLIGTPKEMKQGKGDNKTLEEIRKSLREIADN